MLKPFWHKLQRNLMQNLELASISNKHDNETIFGEKKVRKKTLKVLHERIRVRRKKALIQSINSIICKNELF